MLGLSRSHSMNPNDIKSACPANYNRYSGNKAANTVLRKSYLYKEVLLCQRLQWAEDVVRGLDIELFVPEEPSGIRTVAVSD